MASSTLRLITKGSFPQADYFFKDPETGSVFIGYKITIAVRSGNHSKGENIQVKVRQGLGEKEADKTFYMLGQHTTPQSQTDLTPAPGQFETFEQIPSNTTVCGTSYGQSTFEKANIRCRQTRDQLDLIHFIKVMPTKSIKRFLQNLNWPYSLTLVRTDRVYFTKHSE